MINREEDKWTLSLCGDILISKRMPSMPYAGWEEIRELLCRHECCFANLETTVHRREGYPEAFPGGGYAMADPGCLHDLKRMGLNLFNTANNHAMDYGHNGLLATIKNLTDLDIPYAGSGKNLADACKPAFFECSNGRIALIGVTSSFHDSYAAGPQNQDMQGRPGVAPLKHRTVYELDADNYDALMAISQSIGINNYHNQAIKEGYLPGNENFKFGIYEFKRGTSNKVWTYPDGSDLQRTLGIIADARKQSDLVVVSVHSHQFADGDKEAAPDFIKIFTHECIKAGADIVVCHGPHLLRGIEAYESGIIFYGLGNFIFQHEEMNFLPEEFYRKYGRMRETTTGVGEITGVRSKNGAIGLCTDPSVWRSIFVSITCCTEYLDITLYPIEIMLNESRGKKGLPIRSQDETIVKHIQMLSENLNTKIEMTEAGVGCIRVNRK